jgi:hypothetical protein
MKMEEVSCYETSVNICGVYSVTPPEDCSLQKLCALWLQLLYSFWTYFPAFPASFPVASIADVWWCFDLFARSNSFFILFNSNERVFIHTQQSRVLSMGAATLCELSAPPRFLNSRFIRGEGLLTPHRTLKLEGQRLRFFWLLPFGLSSTTRSLRSRQHSREFLLHETVTNP